MIANFHTHTRRCHHAKGEDREYVLAAIAAGVKYLGFADHSPYWFPGDYYSRFRMTPGEVTGYVESIQTLREEFKDDIQIYIGYEMEYLPAYFENAMKIINSAPCDYLLLGQHFINNEIGEPHCANESTDPARLDKYVAEVTAGLKTGEFFYLCHPDVFYFTGDEDYYKMKMKELCLVAKELDIPLEINLLGIRENRAYPTDAFWQVAGEVGCKAIFGCDAHKPEEMARPDDIEKGKFLADRFKVELIEPTTPIRKRIF